ncbi:MAG: dipicolinate synthase subunit DpsA [Lachnospiraceae bacterium]|nr:dipicolinate synthase subunit DpsA [Lachnospiraceae bacterium]
MEKVIVLGGDHRQYYLADTLQKNGYHVCSYGVLMPEKNNIEWIKPDKVKQEIRESEMIVLPIPVSVDGKTIRQETADDVLLLSELYDGIRAGQKIYGGILSEQLRSVCREKEAFCYDFMEDESVAVGNAVATAEGAVAEAILLGDETIHGKDCLVIGYGKCGAVLADKLKGLQAKVTVMARNPVSRAKARSMGYEVRPMFSHQEVQKEKYKYLFNTVPTLVLTEQVLSGFDRSTVIIDIASKPGGTDFEYCRYAGIRAKLALSLPGKYASRSSGEILAQAIMNS